jgi:hypothetical protein
MGSPVVGRMRTLSAAAPRSCASQQFCSQQREFKSYNSCDRRQQFCVGDVKDIELGNFAVANIELLHIRRGGDSIVPWLSGRHGSARRGLSHEVSHMGQRNG